MSFQPTSAMQPHMRIGAFTIDIEAGAISPTVGGRTRHVSSQAMATLLFLAEHAGQVISRERIVERWPEGSAQSPDALTHAVHTLRDAFNDDVRHPTYIKTVKHRGYQLVAPVDPADGTEAPIHAVMPGTRRRWTIITVLVFSTPVVSFIYQVASPQFAEYGQAGIWRFAAGALLALALLLALVWKIQRHFELPRIADRIVKYISQNEERWIAGAIVVAAAFAAAAFLLTSKNAEKGELASTAPAGDAAIAPQDATTPSTSPEDSTTLEPAEEVATPTTLGPAAALSVAVLPFAYDGNDPAFAYLQSALPDELIAVLSRLTAIQVISRTAAFDPKLNGLDLTTLSLRLQVAHLVEGRISIEGSELRIVVKLVDCKTGHAVWSEKYEQRLGSMFQLYDLVATNVARELEIAISPDTRASFASMRSASGDAYSLYLQGRSLLGHAINVDTLAEAQEYFQRALASDPSFARAFAGLCETSVDQYRSTRDNSFIQPAIDACARANELDPAATEVQLAIARLRIETGEFAEADQALAAVLARNPRSFDGYMRLGELRWHEQRPDDAESAFIMATELQPGNWQGYAYYGAFLISARADYAKAESKFQKVLSLVPGNAVALSNLGACYMFEGRLEEALITYEELRTLEQNGQTLSNLGLVYYYLGRYEDAVATLREASDIVPNDHRVWGNLALAESYADASVDRAGERYARAIELARQRLAVDPSDADALADVATYYADIGNAEAARTSISNALGLVPDDGAIHYLAAIVYELLGDRDEAISALHAAVDEDFPRSFIEGDARLRKLTDSDAYRTIKESDRHKVN